MPKSDYQKLKLLYTADYLMRETDANDKGDMLHGVLLWQIKDYSKTNRTPRKDFLSGSFCFRYGSPFSYPVI